MILAINYADSLYKQTQKYNTKTAYKTGKVDYVISYGPESIDDLYKAQHAYAFTVGDARVGRYGLWRPRIVKEAYDQLKEGDFLIYADSGSYYVQDVHILIDVMNRDQIDIMVFEDCNVEKSYSKRDIFVYLNADSEVYTNTNQRMSGFFVLRKSDISGQFVEQYYELTNVAPFLFTDEVNKLGKENYPEFIDTRHNQSVLSILTKQMKISSYRDPSEWGIYRMIKEEKDNIQDDVLIRSTFPRMFACHRQKKMNFWLARKFEHEYKEKLKKIQNG